MVHAYQFRPMTANDLPLLRNWLSTSHVKEWWGDTDEQFELVRSDLDHPAMHQFIVCLGERPIGYLQCYDPQAWNSPFGVLPPSTRGIDQFIGEADKINCGHGSAFIRAFAESLSQQDTRCVVTDPDPANARAIRAYSKAGFKADRLVDTPDGIALLMVRDQ